MIFLLEGAWLAPLAFGASCDPSGIDAALTSAERAFPSGDLKAMQTALITVHKGMACAREPLPPALCSRIHRAYALEHWLTQDPVGARLSLQAMLDADPHAELPFVLVGERHPLREVLTEAEEVMPTWVDAPGAGWVLVDGVRTGAVPSNQPYVLQALKPDGRASGARLIERTGQEGANEGHHGTTRAALRLTGLGLGVASAALYGAAWASHGAYEDAVLAHDNPRIGEAHSWTNGLSIGSVAALGAGASVVLTAQWIR